MLVRPVMKRLFFLGKPRKKRLASLARFIIIVLIAIYSGNVLCCVLLDSATKKGSKQEACITCIKSTSVYSVLSYMTMAVDNARQGSTLYPNAAPHIYTRQSRFDMDVHVRSNSLVYR